MSDLKVTGTITRIMDIVTGESANGAWSKVVFAIETDGEYPKTVAFTIFGADKVDKFLKYNKVGKKVEVSFDVKSREYDDKFFTDLNAWKVWGLEGQEAAVPAGEDEEDDLPF
jgi:hypothetical protein